MSDARPKNRYLSREEEDELARSKKKVKDVHHADFFDGAHAKAFDFTDFLDKEADFDEEMDELREGLVAVKLSRETKLRIRKPWSNALIIKLIDTHTALEARGRYARLCIQVDVNKPLINTILIGRFEQPVLYEGIHKLCFSCGRIGHKIESCPFTIRGIGTPVEGKPASEGQGDGTTKTTIPRDMHDTYGTTPASRELEENGKGTDVDRYGSWMLVARRKAGQRGTNSSVSLGGPTKAGLGSQPRNKRQGYLGGLKEWANGMGNSIAVEVLERHMADGPFEVGREASASKEGVNVRPHNRSSASVKGKKEIARTKVTKWNGKEIVGSSGKFLVNNSLKWSSLNTIGERNTSPDQFQFSATSQAEVGKQSQRQSDYGGQRIDGGFNNHEPNLGEDSHPMVADSGEYSEVAPPSTINSSFAQ
nr:hypothetical protein CFP56_55110 [Quercus suber]